MIEQKRQTKIESIFQDAYTVDKIKNVPNISHFTNDNTAKEIDCTFLYCDMRNSTDLRNKVSDITYIARIYKAFHYITTTIINNENGSIRSFAGDRLLGIFAMENKETNAVEAAYQIISEYEEQIKIRIKSAYGFDSYLGIGIATGNVICQRIGFGKDLINNNDLVWIGESANLGAKLSDRTKPPYSIKICEKTYQALDENTVKKGTWEKQKRKLNGKKITIYRSLGKS